MCRGKRSGESCSDSNQCDPTLACIPDHLFPHTTRCASYTALGGVCESDYECSLGSMCWYDSPAQFALRTKSCIPKYSYGPNTIFGWASVYYDPMRDIIHNGQLCASGIAFPIQNSPDELPHARCAHIYKLSTNEDNFTDIDQPVKCLASTQGSYCNYYYTEEDYFELACHCGMDGGVGYCPLPGPTTVNLVALAMVDVYAESNCNTKDRDNM